MRCFLPSSRGIWGTGPAPHTELIGARAYGYHQGHCRLCGSATEVIDLGGNIRFADDGPSVDVAATDEASVLLTTQDAETDGDPTAQDTPAKTLLGAQQRAKRRSGGRRCWHPAWSESHRAVAKVSDAGLRPGLAEQ